MRTAAWCRTQRKPSAMSWRRCRASPGARPCGGSDDARHEHRAERDEHRLRRERQRRAGREQRGAERRPGELVDGDEAGLEAGVADARGRRAARASAAASGGVLSANTSAVPSRNSAPRTTAIDDVAGHDGSGEHGEHAGADDGRRTTTSRRRSSRSVSAPANSPNSSGGSHCTVAASATSSASCGQRRHEQRAGGERDAVAEVADATTTRGASGSRRRAGPGATTSTSRLTRPECYAPARTVSP